MVRCGCFVVARAVGEFDGGRFFGCCHLVFNLARWIACNDEVCCHEFGFRRGCVRARLIVGVFVCATPGLKFCSCPGLTDQVRAKDVAMFRVHVVAPCIG